MNTITVENLEELGFVKETDGTDDPRGVSWHIRNDHFHLKVDAWRDVELARVNPDTDFLPMKVDRLYDLRFIVDWIDE